MYCRGMTRTERLRLAKGWAQPQLAEYLGVTQATVSRLENGQDESGPVSRLLDLLEGQLILELVEDEPSALAAAAGADAVPADSAERAA